MSLRVQVIPSKAFKVAADRLRALDKKLPGRMRLLLRRVAQPIMAEQRKAVKSMPVSGKWGTRGTRKKIAKGVNLKLRTGGQKRPGDSKESKGTMMRIRVMEPFPDEKNKGGALPRGFDTSFGGFDSGWGFHQVMKGSSWFMEPAASKQAATEKQVRKILQMSAEEIVKAVQATRTTKHKTK